MFQQFLVPVDFSQRAHVATEVATSWARAFSSKIELIHVVETSPYVYPPIWPGEAPLLADLKERASENATKKIEELAEGLRAQGLDVTTTVVESSSVSGAVQERAREAHSDLIVAATQGKGAVARLLLGSTCERLLRHAVCPVLVARAGTTEPPRDVKKTLVAVDLSDHSRRAVEHAALVAQRWGAELHVFHAWPAPYPLADVRIEGDIWSRMCGAAEKEVAEFLATCNIPAEITPRTAIASGTPVAAITAHADALEPDLLCIGTHGRAGAKHFLLGSVAEGVIRAARCTTLVIP